MDEIYKSNLLVQPDFIEKYGTFNSLIERIEHFSFDLGSNSLQKITLNWTKDVLYTRFGVYSRILGFNGKNGKT